jgi:hypothetical protein|tara:strand:- start:235 stop:660 length:426 start_codon:yes stop_codon:yes gene_type:complete
MKFSLCYKDYDYKVTWAAKREFKRETGRGLWSTIQGVMGIVHANSKMPALDLMAAIGKHIDDVDGAILLWVLAKQCNSALTLAEIADACDRVGWRPVSSDSAYAQPYTYVIYLMLLDIDKMYEEEAIKAKKDLCPSEDGQD